MSSASVLAELKELQSERDRLVARQDALKEEVKTVKDAIGQIDTQMRNIIDGAQVLPFEVVEKASGE